MPGLYPVKNTAPSVMYSPLRASSIPLERIGCISEAVYSVSSMLIEKGTPRDSNLPYPDEENLPSGGRRIVEAKHYSGVWHLG
jgi:hypothetical protein